MNNVNELRKELVKSVFEPLKNKEIDYKSAAVLKGVAATMVASAKVQVDYQKMIGAKEEIEFLKESGSDD